MEYYIIPNIIILVVAFYYIVTIDYKANKKLKEGRYNDNY